MPPSARLVRRRMPVVMRRPDSIDAWTSSTASSVPVSMPTPIWPVTGKPPGTSKHFVASLSLSQSWATPSEAIDGTPRVPVGIGQLKPSSPVSYQVMSPPGALRLITRKSPWPTISSRASSKVTNADGSSVTSESPLSTMT